MANLASGEVISRQLTRQERGGWSARLATSSVDTVAANSPARFYHTVSL